VETPTSAEVAGLISQAVFTAFVIISSGDSVGVGVATGVGVNGGAIGLLGAQPVIMKLIKQQTVEMLLFMVDLHWLLGYYGRSPPLLR
jgi:hypothetical protein